MDATHLPSFHQFDGIKVSADANLMALKRHINGVASFLFKEKELKTRSRRTYFPFTEPSYELDIECKHKSQDKASQCQLCGGEKWIEWCGFGMINAEVFAKAGMSRDSIGYAFGIGIERSVMLVENQKDIRYMIFT
jgi:phenylalanyl-tRNA synthetase alpha chain